MAKKVVKPSSSTASSSSSTNGTRDKPPPLDQWIVPAIGLALAMLGYHFMRGMMQHEIVRVNLEDELELREVFFGEDTGQHNYAVLCHPEHAKYPLSSVFSDAAKEGPSSVPALFRVIDCDHVLMGSEKSIKERFKLSDKSRPVVFVSGKIGPPKQVPFKHLKTGSMLSKALKNLLTPKAEKIETTQDLRTKCLDKPVCALLLRGAKQSPNYIKDAMSKLFIEYPKITFASIDTSVLYVKGLEAEYLPEFEKDVPRFVVFEKVSGTTDTKKDKDSERLKTSVVTLPKGGVSYGPMSNLIASVVQKTASMKKVSTLPTIKTRTKKLEQEEKQKRVRREEQQTRKDGGGGSTASSSSSSGDNDGTADGRRAERDRRRSEHRKNNPNYKEKTPEEIAEIERQRRIRMEEEAQKWNMAPEDMPTTEYGDYMDDGDENWDDDDDADTTTTTTSDDTDSSGDGGEDDDVMDLD